MRIGVDLGGTNVRAGLVKDGRIVRLLSEPCKADNIYLLSAHSTQYYS